MHSPSPCPAPLYSTPLTAATPTNIISLPLGRSSRFVVEQRAWMPPQPFSELVSRMPRESLALEFHTPSRNQAARDLPRVKLSGDGVLNFRPRGGGLKVFYEAKF